MQLFSGFSRVFRRVRSSRQSAGGFNELLIVGILADCLHNWTIVVRLVNCLINPLKRHKINNKA